MIEVNCKIYKIIMKFDSVYLNYKYNKSDFYYL